jgi:MFS family permease
MTMVGVLLGANRAVRLLTNGLAGMLYDRLPRRGLLIASLFLGAVSTLIFAIGYGAAPLLLSRFLWGMAWSGIWVGANAVVLDVSLPENRGRLSGLYQMWFFLGTGIAALFGGVMTDLVGFREGLLIGFALTLLSVLLWLTALPDVSLAGLSSKSGSTVDRTPPTPEVAFSSMPRSFPWPAAISAAIPMFVVRFVFAGVITATAILWLTALTGDGLSVAGLIVPPATLTGAFVALRALISLLGARVSGHLSDLAGRRWLTTSAVLLAGAAGTGLSGSSSAAIAVAGALAAAVTAGGVQALAPAIVGDGGHPVQRGRMLSLVYTLGDLGSALGPPLALWLAGRLAVATLYRYCGGLLALTALFALWRSLDERVLHPR